MGRVKTTLVKTKTAEILEAHPSHFTTNFEENKLRVSEVAEIRSKKLRNTIAGYLTKLVKNKS
ncbi:30S ribosomal protein S17e [Candidatus Woesearchaeota archaeon]|nr:MAG: 30S ribosomal protein S17e [Candidatus Woesearchaeota archaeon]